MSIEALSLVSAKSLALRRSLVLSLGAIRLGLPAITGELELSKSLPCEVVLGSLFAQFSTVECMSSYGRTLYRRGLKDCWSFLIRINPVSGTFSTI